MSLGLIRIGDTGKEKEAETPPPPQHTHGTLKYVDKQWQTIILSQGWTNFFYKGSNNKIL